MTLGTVLIIALSSGLAQARGSEMRDLRDLEKTLAQLVGMRNALTERGVIPDAEELELGRATRLQAIGGLNVLEAAQLGFGPDRVRDWLLPGFMEELRQFDSAEPQGDPAVTGVLVLMRDLEEELRREALRLLFRRGLPNPFEVLGLADADEQVMELAATAESSAPNQDMTEAEEIATDHLLSAEALFQSDEFAAALEHYLQIDPARHPRREAQIRYRTGQCLRKVGRGAEAIQMFRAISADFPESPWASQAEWCASLVETLDALEKARKEDNAP